MKLAVLVSVGHVGECLSGRRAMDGAGEAKGGELGRVGPLGQLDQLDQPDHQQGFEGWLNERLRSWGADEAVLGGYLCGLLADGDPPAEQREALSAILQDILEDDINKHVSEIMDKWQKFHPVVENGASSSSVDVEDRLVKLLGSQSLTTLAPKKYTDEEKKIREAILSQYSQCSDNEEGAIDSDMEGGEKNLARNTNAETVAAAARERREQAKQESQRKKEKDKEDREKQKQLKEEKKEKRKTQKGERKR